MNPSSHCEYIRRKVGSITHLRLVGVIDETFSPEAAGQDVIGHVLIDMGRIERISSFGVRKWIEFSSKMLPGAVSMQLINAPPIVIDQLNLVEGFAGITKVLSFLAPYSCVQCGEERMRSVNAVTDAAAISQSQAPAHKCPACDTPMEFADVPEEFFSFVKNQQFRQPASVVERYLSTINNRERVIPDEAKLSKFIIDDITCFTLSSGMAADINIRRMVAGLEGRVLYDLSRISNMDSGGARKFLDVLDSAATTSEVILWRVPIPVLNALSKVPHKPAAKFGSLWIPIECTNCGGGTQERIGARQYLEALQSPELGDRQCTICGGSAVMVQHREIAGYLAKVECIEPPKEIEAIELRALSQYLASGTAGGKAGTGTGQVNSSGQLEIIRLLGQGGMAEVFLARQVGARGFEKYVVVKKVLGLYALSTEFVDMLFAEARANARLTHPNIVQTFDVGMMDGAAYITMEYVRGLDLKKVMVGLKRKGLMFPLEHALRIVAETAAGLHYAHSYVDPTGKHHPMVHRDVSPHNVLLSLDGAIKLSDFGIAKVAGEPENTKAGVLKGKISYVSPEAVSGLPLDARNDVFGLGVMLFELVTGTLPFRRENEAATLRAIVIEPAPNPSQLNPAVPAELSAIILRALEKDPDNRTPTAGELRQSLEAEMVRLGIQSSPSAVADFVKVHLGAELTEFTRSEAPGKTSGHTGSIQRPVINLGPSPADADADSDADADADDGRDSTKAKPPPAAAAVAPVAPAKAAAPAPAPISIGAAPIAAAAAPVKSPAPAHVPSITVAPLSVAVAPAPSALPANSILVDNARAKAGKAAATAPKSPMKKRLVIGGVALFLLASTGVVASRLKVAGGTPAKIINLGADEFLYVGGVRATGDKVILPSLDTTVSVSKGGRLVRFGNPNTLTELDTKGLAPATGAMDLTVRSTVRVKSNPPGCAVTIGTQLLPNSTPLVTTIASGVEVDLLVGCPGVSPKKATVLGVPGQFIQAEFN